MIFTESENTYTLQIDGNGNRLLHTGLWLAIIGVGEIPPHIALICKGRYYSVSVKRVDTGSSLNSFLKAMERHSKPCLFVNIKVPDVLPVMDIASVFEKYSPLIPNYTNSGKMAVTCLNPVREVFIQAFSNEYSNAAFVFELLTLAKQDGIIGGCESINLPGKSEVTLPKYSRIEIIAKINSISSTPTLRSLKLDKATDLQ